MFGEQKTVNEDQDEPVDFGIASQMLQTSNILYNIYAKYAILGGELSSVEMQAAVGNNYGKLQSALNNFRNILK